MEHRFSTTDPISLREVKDLEGKPYVVGDTNHNDLTIYFENEES